jgi:hypothetical protein
MQLAKIVFGAVNQLSSYSSSINLQTTYLRIGKDQWCCFWKTCLTFSPPLCAQIYVPKRDDKW